EWIDDDNNQRGQERATPGPRAGAMDIAIKSAIWGDCLACQLDRFALKRESWHGHPFLPWEHAPYRPSWPWDEVVGVIDASSSAVGTGVAKKCLAPRSRFKPPGTHTFRMRHDAVGR